MSTQTWLGIGAGVVAALGVGGFFLMRSKWFQVRKYAVELKRIYDRHKLQDKMQAIQQLQAQGVNDPSRTRKPMREVVEAYRGLIADLEKVKAPPVAVAVHEESLTMHREAVQFYQIASTGSFRQREMMKRQQKLQQMERNLQTSMEALYGKPK